MSTPTSSPVMSRGPRTTTSRRSERNAVEDAHEHLVDVEKWFIKRGLPHFIEDYKATDDVFSRALPLFTLLIIVQMGFELTSKTVTWGHRAIGAGVGLGAVLLLFLIANLFRQPKRWYAWPRKVGIIEMSLLVLLGPAVGIVSKASLRAKVGDLAANVIVLGLVYVLVAYAILPVLIWAIQHSVKEVSNLVNLASKALPMLALFGTFIFLNADMWHIASLIERRQLWQTVGFFAAITLLFLMVRLPDEVRKLHGDSERAAVTEAAIDTPLHKLVGELDDDIKPLATNRKQRVNMLFVLGFTQLIQVLLLSLVVFAFFVALGKLLVTKDQMADWLGAKPCGTDHEMTGTINFSTLKDWCAGNGGDEMAKKWDAILNPGHLFGFPARIGNIIFPDALLQTAILITTFSAFFFAVSAVTDESYRKDFFESITGKLTRSLTIRCGYVRLYEKSGDIARYGHNFDERAIAEEHRRTMVVPSLVAQPEMPTMPVSAFQPGGYQQPYQQAQVPAQQPVAFQPQPQSQPQAEAPVGHFPQQPPAQFPQQVPPQQPGYHDPGTEDPFQRWPQQGS